MHTNLLGQSITAFIPMTVCAIQWKVMASLRTQWGLPIVSLKSTWPGCQFGFVIQIKRKLKRKRNRKRNGWRHLRGGASRPPRRFPRFRFRFRFRFNFRLIWITKRHDWKLAHGRPPRPKNSVRKKKRKKQSVSQTIDLVVTMISS